MMWMAEARPCQGRALPRGRAAGSPFVMLAAPHEGGSTMLLTEMSNAGSTQAKPGVYQLELGQRPPRRIQFHDRMSPREWRPHERCKAHAVPHLQRCTVERVG